MINVIREFDNQFNIQDKILMDLEWQFNGNIVMGTFIYSKDNKIIIEQLAIENRGEENILLNRIKELLFQFSQYIMFGEEDIRIILDNLKRHNKITKSEYFYLNKNDKIDCQKFYYYKNMNKDDINDKMSVGLLAIEKEYNLKRKYDIKSKKFRNYFKEFPKYYDKMLLHNYYDTYHLYYILYNFILSKDNYNTIKDNILYKITVLDNKNRILNNEYYNYETNDSLSYYEKSKNQKAIKSAMLKNSSRVKILRYNLKLFDRMCNE